jgi:3-oxoacyl-[acyl-carrier-protein] synthase II
VSDARTAEPVITGFGVISSIGLTASAFWEGLLAGRHGARPVQRFQTGKLRNIVACEIDDPSLDEPAGADGLSRASRIAERAASEAIAHAGLEAAGIDALTVGTTMGDLPAYENTFGAAASPVLDTSSTEGSFAAGVGLSMGITGPATTLVTSCSAGNLAIFHAAELVASGRARRVVAGGSDAISQLAFVGFSRMRAMALERCRPFDKNRTGILLGEGAGFIVVESRASAEARGARIYAQIAGRGLSCDAHHLSTPAGDGRGALAAMRLALAEAGATPAEVGYVAAHGTGTPHNDVAEAKACVTLFGAHRPYVSSLKALIGHTLGAASAIQAVACLLAMRDQRVPPAWHVDTPDPACDVALPPPGCRPAKPLSLTISNGLAFGGNNSCLALRAVS